MSERVDALLARGIAVLNGFSDSPRADAQLLLAHVLGRRRDWLIGHPQATPSSAQTDVFSSLCQRRARGEPIAYLIGTATFYGRPFVVNESVLVPRPETEHLIDEALSFVGQHPLRILDVGTGCGAIACTIAAESNATVDGTDASRTAIALATQNACHIGVMYRCGFHVGNLTEPVKGQCFDVIVANLPYVPTDDLPKRPNPASFEPREALDGGPTGLCLYEQLLPGLCSMANERGLVLLEGAAPTINSLEALVRSHLPNFAISVGYDYAGLPRYVKAVRGGSEGRGSGDPPYPR